MLSMLFSWLSFASMVNNTVLSDMHLESYPKSIRRFEKEVKANSWSFRMIYTRTIRRVLIPYLMLIILLSFLALFLFILRA